MDFQIPQYIEREAKVIGPLTLKQFFFIGTAGVICFILYFSLAFWIFVLVTIVLEGIACSLAFVKVGGKSLPRYIGNFIFYLLRPKIYLWNKKKTIASFKIVKEEKKGAKPDESAALKIAEKSKLKNLATKVETRAK